MLRLKVSISFIGTAVTPPVIPLKNLPSDYPPPPPPKGYSDSPDLPPLPPLPPEAHEAEEADPLMGLDAASLQKRAQKFPPFTMDSPRDVIGASYEPKLYTVTSVSGSTTTAPSGGDPPSEISV